MPCALIGESTLVVPAVIGEPNGRDVFNNMFSDLEKYILAVCRDTDLWSRAMVSYGSHAGA